MSEPDRVPLSVTSATKATQAPFWGLVWLGALLEQRSGIASFGDALDGFMEQRSAEIERVLESLLRGVALPMDDDVRSIFQEMDPRRAVWDARAVRMWLWFWSGARIPQDFDIEDSRVAIPLARHAVRQKLFELVGSTVPAAAAFRAQNAEPQLRELHDALVGAATLAGIADPVEAARWSYSAWCVSHLPDQLRPHGDATEDHRTHLRWVADGLDLLFWSDPPVGVPFTIDRPPAG